MLKGLFDTIGTIRWCIQDANEIAHRSDIPGRYCVPEVALRLLRPQPEARIATK